MTRYCLTHNMMKIEDDEIITELDDCIVVYAPIPNELDGWEYTMSLPEPSEEELLLMEMSAEALEADFIGA
jgi:hypothetical protein